MTASDNNPLTDTAESSTEVSNPSGGNQQPQRGFHVLRLCAAAAGMFAFGYAMVPLYGFICDVTGLNGQSDTIRLESSITESVDSTREVGVEFVTTVNSGLYWDFEAETPKITVNPGKLYTVNFTAHNRMGRDMVAQATPSVVPWRAAGYIRKTECFCFNQQQFLTDEQRLMPVTFIIDRELPDDVETITLSYTFFDATEVAAAAD